jgi:type I restriction enzyme R subunit
MLVRYASGFDNVLEPLPSKVAGKFNLWLGREQRAGRAYTDEQLAWLTAIRDHLAVNAEVTVRDLQDVAAFGDKGGILRARALLARGSMKFWMTCPMRWLRRGRCHFIHTR